MASNSSSFLHSIIRRWRTVVPLLSLAALSACTHHGGDVDQLESTGAATGSATVELDDIWSQEPDIFDDFDRASGARLGRTTIGERAWDDQNGSARIHGGTLTATDGEGFAVALADYSVGEVAFASQISVEGSSFEVGYREAAGIGFAVAWADDTLVLRRGAETVAEVEWALEPGWHSLRLMARGSSHLVMLDDEVAFDVDEVEGPARGDVRVSGSAGTYFDEVWMLGGASLEAAIEASSASSSSRRSGARSASVTDFPMTTGGGAGDGEPGPGNGSVADEVDSGGGFGEPVEGFTVEQTPAMSARAAAAPTLDLTVPTDLYDVVRFLFEGPDAEQQGVDPGLLVPSQVSLVHGLALDETGAPLSGVEVWAHGRPEFGSVFTRADGTYDLVVVGGLPLTVALATDGYLTVHRSVTTEVGEVHPLEDAVMLEVDVEVTPIFFTDPIETHVSSEVFDADGPRHTSLMFRQGTQAHMVFADGSTQPLSDMSVRVTEYTVGELGPTRMPAKIPPGTSYTYAAEISADEAEAQGAVSVVLDTPATLYVDNFMDWPVGSVVPSGAYDRSEGEWQAEEDGLVVEITKIEDGLAYLRIGDEPEPASAEQLATVGIDTAELAELGTLYPRGTQLWRTPIHHFTPFDLNLYGAADGGEVPGDGRRPNGAGQTPEGCLKTGSIIDVDNRALGETLGVVGTPHTLNYQSSRTRGAPNRTVSVEVTDDDPPMTMAIAELYVQVAGREYYATGPNLPNQTLEVQWDGLDAFGRPVQGPQPIDLCIGYYFPIVQRIDTSRSSGDGGGGGGGGGGRPAFGRPTIGSAVGSRFIGRSRLMKCYGKDISVGALFRDTISKADKYTLGGLDAQALSDGLGGWTLGVHHTLSRSTGVLYRGDGTERDVAGEAQWIAERFAGSRGHVGVVVDAPAAGALFTQPQGIVVGNDGSVYVATSGLVRRILPSGDVEAVAGTPQLGYVDANNTSVTGFAGDGGPATDALLSNDIPALAVDADGGVYIADAGNARVRYVDPGGIIQTVVGSGSTALAEIDEGMTLHGGDPLEVSLVALHDIELLPDDEGLLLAQGNDSTNRIRLLTSEGDLLHLAGWNYPDFVDSAEMVPSLSCAAGQCSSASGIIGQRYPFDNVPVLESEYQMDPYMSMTAGMDAPGAISISGDRIFVAEADRLRIIGGRRGGPISTFRRSYSLEPGAGGQLPCNSTGCSMTIEQDAAPPFIGDVVASDHGVFYAATGGYGRPPVGLYHATSELNDTPVAIAGHGDTWMEATDDVMSASDLQMSANVRIARGPTGDVYVSDRNRNLVYRITKGVPPMYVGSTVTSEDASEVYRFDEHGRHLDTRDSRTGGLIWGFEYDESGRLVAVEDRFANRTEIQRDASGIATSIVGPDGDSTVLGHDAHGFLDLFTDPSGESIAFEYESNGLMTSMTDAREGLSTFDYDPQGHLVADTRAMVEPEPVHDATQLLEALDVGPGYVEIGHTSAEGRISRYRRELVGTEREAHRVEFPNGAVNEAVRTPSFESMVAADGTQHEVHYGIDPRLGVNTRVPVRARVELPSGRALQRTVDRSFEPHCEVFTEDCDPLASPTLDADRTVTQLHLRGETWTETYARAHTEAGVAVPATIVNSTPLGREHIIELDEHDRVASASASGWSPIEYAYDERGRPTGVTAFDGTHERHYSTAYDLDGNVESTTDALSRTTAYDYDANGRLLHETLHDGRVVSYTYDEAGNLTSVTPPSRPSHTFGFDSAARVSTATPPSVPGGGSMTTYLYDDDHQLETILRPDGQQIEHEYDEVTGQLLSTMTPEGLYEHQYDAVGRIQNTIAPDGSGLSHAYDGSLMLSESYRGDFRYQVAWDYGSDFALVSESVNDGHLVAFEYDADDSLVMVGQESLVWDPSSGALDHTTVGDVTTEFSYNAVGEVESISYESQGSLIYEVTYTRDEAGRVQSKHEMFPTTSSVSCYFYDIGGRLADVYSGIDSDGCTGTLLEHYEYGEAGNRNGVINDARLLGPSDIIVDEQDRLLEYGELEFTYTANGEVETRTNQDTGDVFTFTYDSMGSLAQVELPSSETIHYLRDARGRRVAKRFNGFISLAFAYGDELNPIAELDANGVVVSRFVYGTRTHVPDYMVRGGRTYRFVTDNLGSVVAVVDVATGIVEQQLVYDAFGRVLSDSNEGFQPFGFAGGIYDPDTGWVLFGARDYRPEVGAWAAKDPIGFAGGDFNLYRYVGSDPINGIDPTGHNLKVLNHASNFFSGFGDYISNDFTKRARQGLGIDDVVDPCSKMYFGGQLAGAVTEMVITRGRRRCFEAGTLVDTAEGLRAIEEIEEGDLVWTRNEDSGAHSWKPVVELFVTPQAQLLELEFEGHDGSTEVLHVTAEHPIWSLDDGTWEEAGELSVDERVDTRGGEMWLTSATTLPGLHTVYNFEVAEAHTYFVGDAGVWTHNACGPTVGGGATMDRLSPSEVRRIQNAANRSGKDIAVVGSRVNPKKPLHSRSDYDYVVDANNKARNNLSRSLPGSKNVRTGTPSNQDIFRGQVNENLPHVIFHPR